MQTVLSVVLQNTVIAAGLALVAVGLGLLRRPAMAHVVWMLVLLKLVTPGVWRVAALPAEKAAEVRTTEVRAAPAVDEAVAAPREETADVAAVVHTEAAPVVVAAPAQRGWDLNWPMLGLAIWGGGSVLLGGLTVWRARRFSLALREARVATGSVLEEMREVAGRLGLRKLPEVRIGPAGISPLVWFVGRRAVVLLPAGIMQNFLAEERRAILGHELAHLRRGDHVVRLFEVGVTVLLWWHPLVWIARRGLRAAEEQACDAWVVWMTGDAAGYARTLLETLTITVAPAPAFVSGLGRLASLRRRLAMVVTTKPGKRPGRMGWVVLVMGAAILPWTLARGQAAAPVSPTVAATASADTDASTTAAVNALLKLAMSDPQQSANALGAIREMRGRAEPAILAARESSDAKLRALAVSLLGAVQRGDERAVQALAASLKDPDEAVREGACTSLGNCPREVALPVMPELMEAVGDKAAAVRVAAINALTQLRPDAKDVNAALTKALTDTDATVRAEATRALGTINANPAFGNRGGGFGGGGLGGGRVVVMAATAPAGAGGEVGDALFAKIDTAVRGVIDGQADPMARVRMTKLTRISRTQWEMEGGTNDRVNVQKFVAAMEASKKFNAVTIWSVGTTDGRSNDFRIQFQYFEPGRGGAFGGRGGFQGGINGGSGGLSGDAEGAGFDGGAGAGVGGFPPGAVGHAQTQMAALKIALDTFEVDNDRYPTTAEGLAALVSAPKGLEGKWHQILKEMPKDPWGNDFVYKTDDQGGFELSSPGPDGKEGTVDDVRWEFPATPKAMKLGEKKP